MGRPQEVSGELMQDTTDQSRAVEENGNGVEHHSPAKSGSYPSQQSAATQEARVLENGAIEAESVPYEDQPVHDNGDTDSSALDDTATVSKEEAPLTPEARLEAEVRKQTDKRLYIARFPRPEDTQLPQQQVLEQRVKDLSDEVSAMNRKVDKLKVERDHVRSQRDSAKASLAICKKQIDIKTTQLEPHRAAKRVQREERESFRQASSELEYKSEKELDDAIKALNFSLSHETNHVTEEKKMIARIKKLEAQRPKVRQLSELRAPQQSAEEAANAKLSKEEVNALEAELDTLFKEKKVQIQIYDMYKSQADDLDREVSAMLEERRKLKAEQDDVYAQLSALKAEAKNKGSDWRENRDFSQHLRELVKNGRVEQAREMAAHQVDRVMKRLAEDGGFKKEYFALWNQQRKSSIFQYEEEAKKAAEASKSQAKPEEWNFDADQVIGAVLDKVTASQVDKSKESGPIAPVTPPKEETTEAKSEAQGGIPVLPQQVQTLGQLQMAMLHDGSGAVSSIKSKGPKKSKVDKKHVIEVPAIVDDKTPFVPPAAVLKREDEEVNEEEERERSRLRNLEAAREAEARKERKRRAAEKKAEQKARASKDKEAQKAAAAAAVAKDDDKGTATQGSEDAAGQESDAAEAATAAAVATPSSAPAQGPSKVATPAVAASKAAPGSSKAAGRPGIRIAGPVAKIRRRKGTADRVLGYVQQQLPKDQNTRHLIYAVAALAAVWMVYGAVRWMFELVGF